MPVEKNEDRDKIIEMLQQKNQKLLERESELAEKQEELQSQKEELTAAIEELVIKNNSLSEALAQLQKRNKELDTLLYRASHDLKTPVTSLQGLVDLMESETTTAEQRNLVKFMDDKLSQMNDILKSLEMLAQSSFEKIEYERVNIKSIVKQVMKDLSYLPHRETVSVHCNFDEQLYAVSDELFLYNIFKSLLSNAILFRDPLLPGNVWINIEESDCKLTIEVTDDGEGISSDISSQIFDMFFRGSEQSIGSGLGLYIARTAVERMKGEIDWESESGKTIFKVILPEPTLNS